MHNFTLARFLAWAPSQEGRFEFDGVQPIAMTGDNLRHGLIASSVFAAIYARLDFSQFQAVCGHGKVIANGHVRYPDVFVFRPAGDSDDDSAHAPVMVVEVLSPSTTRVDKFDKNVDYASTPSIQHYVMLSQERRSAVVCSRTAEGWVALELEGAGSISLPAIGMELPFDEIYCRVITAEDDAS